MNKIFKNTLILTAITLISGLLLGLVYEVTKDPIAAAKNKAKQEAYQKVLPDADSFEGIKFKEADTVAALKAAGIEGAVIDEAACAYSGDEQIGFVVTATDKNGYGGNIQVSVGILADGTVNGVAILSINETAGLGMKATEPDFYGQYAGKAVSSYSVTKNGASSDNEIDALSGATITSKAVTGAVNAALAYYQTIGGGLIE